MVKVIVAKGVKGIVVKDVPSRKPNANVKAVYTGPLDPEDAYDEQPKRSKPDGRKNLAMTAPEQAKEKRPTHMGYADNISLPVFTLFGSETEAKKWKKSKLIAQPNLGVYIGKIIQ